MEDLVDAFGNAVDNEIITIDLGAPRNGVSILRVHNNILGENLKYEISYDGCIHWYEIAMELRSLEWL